MPCGHLVTMWSVVPERETMKRHQRAESAGLISFFCCAVVGGLAIMAYLRWAPAIWQLSQRRFMAAAALVGACGVVSFVIGYTHRIRMLNEHVIWAIHLRRSFEIVALSFVYAVTLFLTSYTLFWVLNSMMGKVIFEMYLPALTATFAGVCGYLTFVQAELMNAKTLASLLPFFVIAGVGTACSTTNDPHWFRNNFSELGDRTTFAASMFNITLVFGGLSIIIITYFAISELIATYQVVRPNGSVGIRTPQVSYHIPRFKVRITLLSILLTLSGIAFIGIGTFRYTPHPILHNVFARGMPCVMFALLITLPWLAPQLSRAFFVISDIAILVCVIAGISWLQGENTLTNVEALAAMLFLGWFIGFSRQIAAIEADRIQQQLIAHEVVNTAKLDDLISDEESAGFNTVLTDTNSPVLAAQADTDQHRRQVASQLARN